MDEKLKNSLERLQLQLQQATPKDQQTKERIEHLKGVVAQTLAENGADHASLGDRIRAAVLHFEQEHPALTSAADEVTVALAQVGI